MKLIPAFLESILTERRKMTKQATVSRVCWKVRKGDKEVIKTLNDSDSSEQERDFCRTTTGPLGRSAVKDACVSRQV